jgi:Piwi domain
MSSAAPPMWSNKPTMLIGIDVSHPQSFDQNEPSIVGITASMDKSFAQCAAGCTGHKLLLEPTSIHRVHSQITRTCCSCCHVAASMICRGCHLSLHCTLLLHCSRDADHARARRYACRIKRIGYREEVIAGMKEEMIELFKLFREHNNAKPESIVVYRDGVSQGEFKEVRSVLLDRLFASAQQAQSNMPYA